MSTLSNNAAKVLEALRANAEGPEADGFRSIYLDNARPSDMSVNTFRAQLRTLAGAGLYKVVDGYAFGDVKVA